MLKSTTAASMIATTLNQELIIGLLKGFMGQKSNQSILMRKSCNDTYGQMEINR